jgi:class 3 adenylate cyclase
MAGHHTITRDRILRSLYRRCGTKATYWLVMAAAQGASSVLIAGVTVILLATFFDPPAHEVAIVAAVGATFTVLSIGYAALRTRPMLVRFQQWRATDEPLATETAEVWHLAATNTWATFRRHAARINLLAILPATAVAAWLWDAGWGGALAMALACAVPAYYATAVNYSIGELLSRPMLDEIAHRLPDDVGFRPGGLSLARRFRLAMPAYTTTASMLTVGLLGHADGARALAITTAVSLAVGVGLAAELTVLLGDAVTGPVRRIRVQLAKVRDGDFTARTPVITSDEIGELTHDVNVMTHGLAEREEIRAAFGTYLDRGVVDLILSGQVPPEGVEVTVSILFCDVRGFTSYAEQATAPQVIATLNEMFAAIVPVVEKHGGHVDKFLGDGMLAVFGTPRPLADHADRAVEAACEIVQVVARGASGLTVAAGVNTGTVVAGPLGGSGRLNFSVIGDAVNVAARVEAATRQTGDDVLITDATRQLLTGSRTFESRGGMALKGKADPIELFAPTPVRTVAGSSA